MLFSANEEVSYIWRQQQENSIGCHDIYFIDCYDNSHTSTHNVFLVEMCLILICIFYIREMQTFCNIVTFTNMEIYVLQCVFKLAINILEYICIGQVRSFSIFGTILQKITLKG